MGGRGRKSGAELGIVQRIPQRPEPPSELTPEQAEEWREIVARMPATWFGRETWPRLCTYCRHVSNARHIARLIEDARGDDLGDRVALMRLNRLLAMQERQSSILAGLATCMRLTNQSRYTARSDASQAGRSVGKPTWEI